MKSHLKVKLYSLTTEMTYIRRQEEKWKNKARLARQKSQYAKVGYAEDNFWSHHEHRKDLKSLARTTHLAHGALKGVPYSAMEYISYGDVKGYNRSAPNWSAIAETVDRFTRDEPAEMRIQIMQRLGEWLSDAKKWYDGNPERIAEFNSEEAKVSRAAAAAQRKKVGREAWAIENAFHSATVVTEPDAAA